MKKITKLSLLVSIIFVFALNLFGNNYAYRALFRKKPATIEDTGKAPKKIKSDKPVFKRFSGGPANVYVEKNEDGHWILKVDGEPFVVKGMNYSPTKVGLTPDITPGAQTVWMIRDDNTNSKIDVAYDTWVDSNNNNVQDPGEVVIGDFQLMKDMGVNAIRVYNTLSTSEYQPTEFNKELFRDLYNTYGIRIIMGNYFGAYTIGSGADWGDGTDYTNETQKNTMRQYVMDMVNDHKDEPYVLMWLLGNECESPYTNTNAGIYLSEYSQFVNEVAGLIKTVDTNHPVAVCNWNLPDNYSYYGQAITPNIDIYALNAYMGTDFGTLWEDIKNNVDLPVLITEYGCDAYDGNTFAENQEAQKNYHKTQWQDIARNTAGYYLYAQCKGNSIGGVVFEWVDEWWKDQAAWEPWHHNVDNFFPMAFPDGQSQEEWLGIVGLNNGLENTTSNSPYQRNLRQAYYEYKNNLWAQELPLKKPEPIVEYNVEIKSNIKYKYYAIGYGYIQLREYDGPVENLNIRIMRSYGELLFSRIHRSDSNGEISFIARENPDIGHAYAYSNLLIDDYYFNFYYKIDGSCMFYNRPSFNLYNITRDKLVNIYLEFKSDYHQIMWELGHNFGLDLINSRLETKDSQYYLSGFIEFESDKINSCNSDFMTVFNSSNLIKKSNTTPVNMESVNHDGFNLKISNYKSEYEDIYNAIEGIKFPYKCNIKNACFVSSKYSNSITFKKEGSIPTNHNKDIEDITNVYKVMGLKDKETVTIHTSLNKDNEFVLVYYDSNYKKWMKTSNETNSDNSVSGVISKNATHIGIARINEQSLEEFKVYPNPCIVSKHGSVKFQGVKPNGTIRIYTISGELVSELIADASGNLTWDVKNKAGRNVASGVYLCRAQTNNGKIIKKLGIIR